MANNHEITLIVKPTHRCNLHCPYCYDRINRKFDTFMDLSTVDQLVAVFKDSLRTWIWHGGEPLLAPLEFYYAANERIMGGTALNELSMQTNGTLITQDVIDMFKQFNIRPGFSFDGIYNEFTRKSTAQIMLGKLQLDKNGIQSGPIMLLTPDNIDNIIAEYEYFKRLNFDVQMNIIFSVIGNEDAQIIPPEHLAKKICEFFDYWMNDLQKPAQSKLCETYLYRLMNGGHSFCSDQDCVGKWFGVHPDGTLMPCGNDWQEDMTFGNIHEYTSVEEIMEHPNFVRFKAETRELLDSCKECPFFYACHGGCYATAYNTYGNCKKPNKEHCIATKIIFTHIFNRIKDIDISTDGYKYNPHFSRVLYKLGHRGLPLIRESLASET